MLRSAERYVATLHPNASAPVTRLASEDLFSAVPRSSAVKLPPLQNRRPVFNVKAAKGFNPDETAIGGKSSIGLKTTFKGTHPQPETSEHLFLRRLRTKQTGGDRTNRSTTAQPCVRRIFCESQFFSRAENIRFHVID